MYRKLVFIAIAIAAVPAAADEGQQFAELGDLTLVSGEILEDARVGYRTVGVLNAERSNIIVVPTWFTGTSQDFVNFGIVGPDGLADTNKYYVVVFDAFGNGVSSSPSNSKAHVADKFPSITTEDMVNAQYEVLTGHLNIGHVKAVIGISMGGMQTFQWMTSYPDFMDKAVPIDGSPKMTSYDIIQWQTHKDVIEAMQASGHGNDEIMELISPLNQLTLFTPDYIVENVEPENLDKYLQDSLDSYGNIDGYDYVSQLEAMLSVDLLGASSESRQRYSDSVSAAVLIVGTPSDHMVNPTPARRLAAEMGADYFEVESNCGHIGSSCEQEVVIARVNKFLEQ